MKVFVTIEMFQGVVHDATAYLTGKSARRAERVWLKGQGIKSRNARECKSDQGTSFSVMECDLKP
jgi:predicted CoA-binding protein